LFRNLLFGLVSEESSFYAPYLKLLYEDLKNDNNQNQTPKVQITLEDAMQDLGLDNE
tara:strand:- start:532 stop:702 length:171 start_codon:yes stop_codon:yes gene_type:complete